MAGIAGTELEVVEKEVLRHPSVGGVILFSRNYRDREQLRALCDSIHALRHPPLLIAVDQEGGRVQRFRHGFTVLPAAAQYGVLHDRNRERAHRAARAGGWVMAAELRASGVDFSFAPVLDLDRGVSTVIGDRAFHRDPDVVTALAGAFLQPFDSQADRWLRAQQLFRGFGHAFILHHHHEGVEQVPIEIAGKIAHGGTLENKSDKYHISKL